MKSKFISSVLSLLIAAVWVAQALKARADLTHRYSFATDASDSVGTAHGTLVGNAAVDSGIVNFEGTSGTFVDLPAGMISNYTSVTFEFWANIGANGNWCELYAFGDRNPGGNGRHMVILLRILELEIIG